MQDLVSTQDLNDYYFQRLSETAVLSSIDLYAREILLPPRVTLPFLFLFRLHPWSDLSPDPLDSIELATSFGHHASQQSVPLVLNFPFAAEYDMHYLLQVHSFLQYAHLAINVCTYLLRVRQEIYIHSPYPHTYTHSGPHIGSGCWQHTHTGSGRLHGTCLLA